VAGISDGNVAALPHLVGATATPSWNVHSVGTGICTAAADVVQVLSEKMTPPVMVPSALQNPWVDEGVVMDFEGERGLQYPALEAVKSSTTPLPVEQAVALAPLAETFKYDDVTWNPDGGNVPENGREAEVPQVIQAKPYPTFMHPSGY